MRLAFAFFCVTHTQTPVSCVVVALGFSVSAEYITTTTTYSCRLHVVLQLQQSRYHQEIKIQCLMRSINETIFIK